MILIKTLNFILLVVSSDFAVDNRLSIAKSLYRQPVVNSEIATDNRLSVATAFLKYLKYMLTKLENGTKVN